MKVAGAAAVTLFALGAAAGCARPQARTPEAVIALEIPPPPARVPIPVILPEPEDAPPETVADTPAPTPPRSREPNTAARDRAPAANTTPPVPPETPSTGPVLQTTTRIGEVAQKTLGLLAAAQRDLDRVGYSALGANARAQYDLAQSFIRQAKSALSIKNYNYAEQLADRAAAIASQLVKG